MSEIHMKAFRGILDDHKVHIIIAARSLLAHVFGEFIDNHNITLLSCSFTQSHFPVK